MKARNDLAASPQKHETDSSAALSRQQHRAKGRRPSVTAAKRASLSIPTVLLFNGAGFHGQDDGEESTDSPGGKEVVGADVDRTLNAAAIAHEIVLACFGIPASHFALKATVWLFVICSFLPGVVRLSFGLPMFGVAHFDKVCYAGMFISIFLGMQTCFGFVIVAEVDFRRRVKAMEMMTQLISYPGVKWNDLFPGAAEVGVEGNRVVEEEEETPRDEESGSDGTTLSGTQTCSKGYLFLDLSNANNAFAWHLMRRVLRHICTNFHVRARGYIGILVVLAIVATYGSILILYLRIRHHFATLCLILLSVLAVTSLSISALFQGQALQACVPELILKLKRLRMRLSQEVMQVTGGVKSDSNEGLAFRSQRLTYLNELLRSIEEIIQFEEMEQEPVAIFGATAGPGLISAVFGTIATGLIIACETIYQKKLWRYYDEDGWFDYSR